MIWEPYQPSLSIYVRKMPNARNPYFCVRAMQNSNLSAIAGERRRVAIWKRYKNDFRCGECNEFWTNDQNDEDTDTCPWCKKLSHRLHHRII